MSSDPFKSLVTCGFLCTCGQRRTKSGQYRRTSDGVVVQRFRCRKCKNTLSQATYDPLRHQRKRHLNRIIISNLVSTMSQRRCALVVGVNRKTVIRKFLFFGSVAKKTLITQNAQLPKAAVVEFDDLETSEHTQCKPLSVTVAVESQTRRILTLEVSQMPPKGRLAQISRQKYGPRPDHRPSARHRLFLTLKDLVLPLAEFKTDKNPHYPPALKAHFPSATHSVFKGRKATPAGQGEMKRGGYDPLFAINHTCAKFRADTNRLIRKTWCTTKRALRLEYHMSLVALYHNANLTSPHSKSGYS